MKFTTAMILAASFCGAGLTSVPAYADDKSDIRKAIECMPAKDIIKLLTKFDKFDPETRDTVDAFIAARFNVEEGQALPDRMFMRSGDSDTSLTINSDGRVTDFDRIGQMDKNGEICVEDQARAGISREEDGISFSVDFDVKFKNTPGRHSLAELQDGAKDGKSFYKKLVPAPIRLLIPKMTHISITFDDPEAEGQTIEVFAETKKIEGLVIEPFGKSQVIEIDQVEALGADTLVVSGGAYDLEPSPSIEKMKKLGFSEGDEDGEGKSSGDNDGEED